MEQRPLPGLDQVRAELENSTVADDARPDGVDVSGEAAGDEPGGVEMEEPTTWDDRRAETEEPPGGFLKRLRRALRLD